MGLDGVDLLLAIEDTFHIHITDHEACSVRTVGDLHKLILSKIQPIALDDKPSSTSATFYEVRRTLTTDLGIPKTGIKPQTPLSEVFPLAKRRIRWSHFQKSLPMRTPSLEIEMPILLSMLATATLLTLLVIPLGPFAVCLVVVAHLALLRPLTLSFPSGTKTIGELVENELAPFNPIAFRNDQPPSRGEIWQTLCRIIAHQTAADPEKLKPESRLADLGID